MSQVIWTTENYPYRGASLKPHMLAELAERYFPGTVMSRRWLVEDAPRLHAELGGAPALAEPTAQAKKARKTLLADGWEQAGYGGIRRSGGTTSSESLAVDAIHNVDEIESPFLDAQEWIGEGEETVYCYTFPSYIELAALKNESRLPLKIGKTSSMTLERVALQCGTSNPEQPVVPFAVRVSDAILYEKAIQRILTIWNRWIDDAPGSEWFMTSKDEVLEIVAFLSRTHGTNGRKEAE